MTVEQAERDRCIADQKGLERIQDAIKLADVSGKRKRQRDEAILERDRWIIVAKILRDAALLSLDPSVYVGWQDVSRKISIGKSDGLADDSVDYIKRLTAKAVEQRQIPKVEVVNEGYYSGGVFIKFVAIW